MPNNRGREKPNANLDTKMIVNIVCVIYCKYRELGHVDALNNIGASIGTPLFSNKGRYHQFR